MNCQFLCTSHANQLALHLEATAPIWSSWMRQGEVAQQASELDLSIQYFGCAYDLAVMLVDRFTAHGELDGQRHVERLLQSGTRLAQSLARCGHLALRREYLNKIRQRLYREQLRLPLLAARLPQLDESLAVTLDAYSSAIRRRGSVNESARRSLN